MPPVGYVEFIMTVPKARMFTERLAPPSRGHLREAIQPDRRQSCLDGLNIALQAIIEPY